jgi:chromatin remodeling complex protein RSC6
MGMKKKKNTNRQPSGFVKPTRISDELAGFLAKPIGSEMARTQLTREINTYIKAHNLAVGRNINPDAPLLALLKIPADETLNYFNLQKYMSPHFHKNVKPTA